MQVQLFNDDELFNDLMRLCEGDDPAFFFSDQVLDDYFAPAKFRIFNYHLASYTDFQKPNALNCRGTMFQMLEDGKPILASLPFAKFFNYMENPFTMNVDFSDIDYVLDKMDGSLISTYIHFDEKTHTKTLLLKSKGSLKSEQAIDAYEWLSSNQKCANLYNLLVYYAFSGHTVNLEWTAPHNHIVLGYQEPRLTVLGVRDHFTGKEIHYDEILDTMREYCCEEYLCDRVNFDDGNEFVDSIPNMDNIEGYVITLKTGQKVKVKTDWYVSLHRSKDSVGSPKRLFECVVNEAHDDLRGMFPEDEYLMGRIDEMETKVRSIYKDIAKYGEDFYNENKHLERKDFAILGQKELPPKYFHIAMALYTGKNVDYKEWMLKHYKDFGIKDDTL